VVDLYVQSVPFPPGWLMLLVWDPLHCWCCWFIVAVVSAGVLCSLLCLFRLPF
jgi:hypothetical protein